MADPTTAQIVSSGSGRQRWVFHIGGMPWAVSNAGGQTFIDNIPTNMLKQMFGDEWYTDGGTKYFADEVDIYPGLLDTPGEQTIKLVDGQGTISGGTWTAKIKDLPVAPAWPHNKRSNIAGIEGLQAMSQPRDDNTIAHATLYSLFGKTTTALMVEEDYGDLLDTRITAASGDPYFLWCGGECFAASAVSSVSTGLNITVPQAWRGLLRSRKQSFQVNTVASSSMSIKICDAPLNGVISRPYYLWLFVVDETDTPIANPVLFRHGKVGTQVAFDGKRWSSQCLPWWSWLDTDIDIEHVTGMLAKYVFSRGASGSDAPPHMQLREWDSGTSSWLEMDIWLCSADSTVTFDTAEEVRAAAADECTTQSAASGNTYVYECPSTGPYSADAPTTWNTRPQIRGPLPAIFGWGSNIGGDGPWYKIQKAVAQYEVMDDAWHQTWWSEAGILDAWIPSATEFEEGSRPEPTYIYQWYGTSTTTYEDGGTSGWTKKFVWPENDTSNTPRMWIHPMTDVSGMAAGESVQLGTDEFKICPYVDCPDDKRRTTLSAALIDAVGAGGSDNNYLDLDYNTDDFPAWPTELACLCARPSDSDGAIGGWPPGVYKFSVECYLYYRPDLHNVDPWPVRQNFDVTTSKLSTLFKALFGSTADITLPEQVQCDHIPDSLDGDANYWSTIDWDQIDSMIDETASSLGSVSFRLRYSGRLNIWKLLQNEMRFWGLTLTYEYEPTIRQYVIRCRKMGVINATVAYSSGRYLNQDTIKSGEVPRVQQSPDWLFNAVDLSLNWNSSTGEFGYKLPFAEKSGFAPTGGRRNVLKVEPRITRIDTGDPGTESNLRRHFACILDRAMHPRPTQSLGASVKNLFSFGVGVECSVTVQACHQPYSGVVSITDWPSLITEMRCNPSRALMHYTYRLAQAKERGWAPALQIAANGSTIEDTETLSVQDISGSGQLLCNEGVSTGWYDHWFFANIIYNESMSAPQYGSSGGANYPVRLVRAGTTTPTTYGNLEAQSVSLDTYATITGAGGDFMVITGPANWTVGFDTTKAWWLCYEDWDHVDLQPTQQSRFFAIGESDGTVTDVGANVSAAEEWKP